MDFNTFRTWFDTLFIKKITENISDFNEYSLSKDVEAVSNYLIPLASHGKRFRPYLAYIALNTSTPEEHIDLFIAIELLHVFALIHDDVMDNGIMRHGVPCAHKQYEEIYKNQKTGDNLAILLGDLVYQWSYESILLYTTKNPLNKEKILHTFNILVKEVIHGQMLDVIAPVGEKYSLDLIIQKMYLKTARYSFVHPIQLGYIAKGENKELFAESFGKWLGIMFQMQDDLLDVTYGTDKSSFLDIETKQQTLLDWYMHREASEEYREAYMTYVGRRLSDDEKEKVYTILEQSGANTYVQDQIESYYQKAIHVEGVDEKWKEVAQMVYKRNR